MHAALIINPASGKAGLRHSRREIESLATHFGWEGLVLETTQEVGADKLCAQVIKKGVTHIIVCGGDGTVAQALKGLVGSEVTLSIIPIGTGNLLATNLGIPTDVKRAMAVAFGGETVRIDVGQVNSHYFAAATGLGWDAAVVRDAHPELKRKIGLFAYLVAALKNIGHPFEKYTVVIDDDPLVRIQARSVLVFNLGTLAKGLRQIVHTTPTDGYLSVVIIQAVTLSNWIRLVVNGLLGRLSRDPLVSVVQAKEVTIHANSARQPFQIDGSDMPDARRLTIRVIPRALSITVPSGSPARR